MNNQSQLVEDFMKLNASKAKVGTGGLCDYIKERGFSNVKVADMLETAKGLGYTIDKKSIVNPHYQPSGKQLAKQSSKTKAQIVQVEARPVTESDIQTSLDSAVQMIASVVSAQTQAEPVVVEEQEPEVADVSGVDGNVAMDECYSLMYDDNHKQYMKDDFERVQCGVGKDARYNRIRALISDPELVHADFKNNPVFQIMYSAVQMLKLFRTPREKCREVHVMWLTKLASYASKDGIVPEHAKILEILRSL